MTSGEFIGSKAQNELHHHSLTVNYPRPLIANAMLSWTAQPSDDWTQAPKLAIPYLYGRWLPSTGWDCSGCFGYTMAAQLGCRSLPGVPESWYADMSFHPGPADAYMHWEDLFTVHNQEPIVGDVLCWPTHVGVAISPTLMVSALSPSYGTYVSPFTEAWVPQGPPVVRRMIWSKYTKLVEA